MKVLILAIFLFCSIYGNSQIMDSISLPYVEIPEYPENYSAGNVLARTIDGLGYRYYWATEGLTIEDLKFKLSEDSRSNFETIEHLYGLSQMIVNTSRSQNNVRPRPDAPTEFNILRSESLSNFKEAADWFRDKSAEELSKLNISFERNGEVSKVDLWHLLNGPLGDALWHTGQIVLLRRASGNPINPKVNVFMGRNRD